MSSDEMIDELEFKILCGKKTEDVLRKRIQRLELKIIKIQMIMEDMV